jgi:hypothetical protein
MDRSACMCTNALIDSPAFIHTPPIHSLIHINTFLHNVCLRQRTNYHGNVCTPCAHSPRARITRVCCHLGVEKLCAAILFVLRGRRRKSHNLERVGSCPQRQLRCLQRRAGLFFNGPNIKRRVRSHNAISSSIRGREQQQQQQQQQQRVSVSVPPRHREVQPPPLSWQEGHPASQSWRHLSSPIRQHWRHLLPLAVETSHCATVASTTAMLTCLWAQHPL